MDRGTDLTAVAPSMRPDVARIAMGIPGFLTEAEGLELFQRAREASVEGPCVEIGSYCGRSSLFLAEGCRVAGRHPVFCIDHHRGSVEHQLGQDYFDYQLFDTALHCVDSLPAFRRNLTRAYLEDWAIPMVCGSSRLARYWPELRPALVFIDGSHDESSTFRDYLDWGRRVRPNGYLCVHDYFESPELGGSAPYEMVQAALRAGGWRWVGKIDSLVVLQCTA